MKLQPSELDPHVLKSEAKCFSLYTCNKQIHASANYLLKSVLCLKACDFVKLFLFHHYFK